MVNDLVGLGKFADSIEKGTKEIRQLAYDFLAPSVREAGQLVADRIRFNRISYTIEAMKKAISMVKDANLNLKPVDLKTFMPLIEFCSFEEDPGMVDKWAGLLASAASGGIVLPSFTRILAELSPDEARILDYIFINRKKYEVSYYVVNKNDLKNSIGLTEKEYGIRIVNLIRLNLIAQITTDADIPLQGYFRSSKGVHVGLTMLGETFISSCRGPSD